MAITSILLSHYTLYKQRRLVWKFNYFFYY
uniref:Uncharacterized protein n=1 Tax=Anguilla anguilla TaxID=7936 RepID=A0A0E9TIT7_ANGAN